LKHDNRPDSLLVQAIAEGHLDALEPLVRRHQDGVRRLAYRFLGEWSDANDVAQDAFLRVVRAAPRYQPTARFTTWLHRIVVNLCLDSRRRRARFVAADLPDGPACLPPDVLERDETVRRVRQALNGLPERQRTAVILHRYEGHSHREIAEVTGWSESAVESLLVRGYANLRRVLADADGNSDGRPPENRPRAVQ
jgi:RNA polymerase sigma-70 factor (ECF subfamily)